MRAVARRYATSIVRYVKANALVIVLLFVLLSLFLELADDVWRREGFAWDAPLMLGIHRYSRPWLDQVMLWVTRTGSDLAFVFLMTLSAWLLYSGKQLEALFFIASFVGAVSLNCLLKLLFARPRPEVFPPLVVAHTYSFPSGHTIAAVSLYGLLALYLWHEGLRVLASFSASWVLAVAFSRIYLGAHYPSDVLGAMAVGGIWLIVIWKAYARLARDRETPRG